VIVAIPARKIALGEPLPWLATDTNLEKGDVS
jgi:hypothetical protein